MADNAVDKFIIISIEKDLTSGEKDLTMTFFRDTNVGKTAFSDVLLLPDDYGGKEFMNAKT